MAMCVQSNRMAENSYILHLLIEECIIKDIQIKSDMVLS